MVLCSASSLARVLSAADDGQVEKHAHDLIMAQKWVIIKIIVKIIIKYLVLSGKVLTFALAKRTMVIHPAGQTVRCSTYHNGG